MSISPIALPRILSRILALGLILVAGAHAPCARADEDYVKSYTIDTRAQVVVHTGNGRVHIISTDSNRVELRVRSTGSFWGIGMGEPPRTESRQDGDRVALTVRSNWQIVIMGVSTREAQIEVRMPRNADLKIETHDASVDVASLAGDINVHTFNGAISAQQLSGRIELRSHDGRITARDLQGELRLDSFNGAIDAASLTGRCEASSHDGQIQLTGRFELLDTASFNGGIIAQAEPGSQISSEWRVSTHDGRVQLGLPRELKASLDASTHDGPIELRLPINVQGPVSRTHLHGVLNGGGAGLIIRSFNGRIVLQAT
jgi:DUF4097 and DUF4098 domain-containing protein YvlB